MSFADALDEELAGTPWLYGPVGRAFVGVAAARQDTAIRQIKDVGLMRDPLLAPEDALTALAADRYIPTAPPDAVGSDAYRARLSGAIEWWTVGGTGDGYVQVFEPYGFDADTCQFLSNHEVDGLWDGADWFSRVFGFLDSTSGYFFTDGVWSDGLTDTWSEEDGPEGYTWDSSAQNKDLAYFRSAIRLQKADFAYPVTVAVWLQGDGTLPDGYWQSPGLYDDGGDWEDLDLEQPVYWTLGNVWGQETWTADGLDFYPAETADPATLTGADAWIDYV